MDGPSDSALLTDFYQLTMLEGYLAEDMHEEAVFEFFVRKLPDKRGFLLAAGLAQVVDYLERLRFTAEELDWLDRDGRVGKRLVNYLSDFSFTGDVDAMPEGTPFFPDEPIVRVSAPLPQAQLVESRIINLLHLQTVIASKAARMVLAAPGMRLIDFGFRRAHGAEAGLLAARAAYIAGFAGTATVEAGRRFAIPVYGTVAHSFIQAHESEQAAFLSFARAQPKNAVLLIDTYDTAAAAKRLVELAPTLAADGIAVRGVRIDSGDLIALSREVRGILDAGGLRDVQIFASGGLDEYVLAEITAAKAPIEGCGVGTSLTTAADAPNLDCAYKLQEYAGEPRRKRSAGKATWPGRKQVFRRRDENDRMIGDVLTLRGDEQAGTPLLRPVLRHGRRVAPADDLDAIRNRTATALAGLPDGLKDIERPAPYPVEVAPALKDLTAAFDAAHP